MGVFEQFPYANMHEMNLEWLLKKMKELDKAMEIFKATESLKFADPIIWNISTQYEKSTIVLDPTGNAYLSLQPVPTGMQLNNEDYWLEIFNFTDYTRTANQNLTVNTETNTTRATAAYQVDDWLIWNDVLYRVTSAIAIDDALIVAPSAGSNIVHFTVEDFIKAFITYATNLINQYKNDIDASELAYRQQLAQDIANTTASLQAQLNAAISGATVDSEVINARVGADGVTYPTLGDAIRTQFHNSIMNRYSFTGTDANSVTENSIYYMSGTTQHLPTSDGYFVITILYASGSTTMIQLAYKFSDGHFYWRRAVGGTWEAWKDHISDAITSALENVLLNMYTYSGTDANSVTDNSIYYMSGSTQHLPTSDGYFVITILYAAGGSTMIQLAYKFSDGHFYWRRAVGGTWEAWKDPIKDLFYNGFAYSGNDCNNIVTPSIYFAASTVLNLPTTDGYFIETFLYNEAATAAAQIAYKYSDGSTYYRRKVSGSWEAWKNISRFSIVTNAQAYMIGDSLMYGALWVPTSEAPYYNVIRAPYVDRIASRIANATNTANNFTNRAVGGAAFVGSGNTILSQLQSSPITSASLIVISGGRNDSNNPLGNKNSTINDGTICGAIKEIIEYIKTNAPLCQIVMLGVTPNTNNNSDIFTHVYPGGWSLNSYDEKVSELCADYGVPYIDWKSCTAIYKWADYSGAGGVYSHPNTEVMYRAMGCYAGGQIAKYYTM